MKGDTSGLLGSVVGTGAFEAGIPLGLVGCDYGNASTRWRSALVLLKEEREKLTADLIRSAAIESVVFLETCNRNEWIFAASNPCWAGEILRAQMLKRWSGFNALSPRPYVLVGDDAVRHVLRVAAGLESFVQGERQIAGQLNRALERARREGASSAHLNGLGAIAARVARDAHVKDEAAGGLRGVHDVTARYLHDMLPPPARVLVIGMGEIGRRVASELERMPGYSVLRMNRTARRPEANILPLSELATVAADAVVVCTAAPGPVISAQAVPNGCQIVLDLGIPSQVHEDVSARGVVRRVDLDDLLQGKHAEPPMTARTAAFEKVVEDGQREFVQFCQRRRFIALLDRTRRNHESFVAEVLPEFLDASFGADDTPRRRDAEYRLRGIFRHYTNSIFHSIDVEMESESVLENGTRAPAEAAVHSTGETC